AAEATFICAPSIWSRSTGAICAWRPGSTPETFGPPGAQAAIGAGAQPGDKDMRGTMLVFQPHAVPQVREFSQPPTLEEVQAVIGGDLQLVPGFRTIRYGAAVMDCFALCNANGKHKGLPMNDLATIAWKAALRRAV